MPKCPSLPSEEPPCSLTDQFNQVSCSRWEGVLSGWVWLSLQVRGASCHGQAGAECPGWRQLAQHKGRVWDSIRGGQRSPLWGSTLRVSRGWLRDSLGKRGATLGRLFLFSGSPGGVMSL